MGFPALPALVGLILCGGLLQHCTVSMQPGMDDRPKEYFWNEITGEVQWEDPGGVPHEDEHGNQFWLTKDGHRSNADPEATTYTWIEGWSEEWTRPYFFNQETHESIWDRPADMAWRRAPAKTEL